jgi:hypothetical protein
MTDGDKVAAATLAAAYCAAQGVAEMADMIRVYTRFCREIEAQQAAGRKPATQVPIQGI